MRYHPPEIGASQIREAEETSRTKSWQAGSATQTVSVHRGIALWFRRRPIHPVKAAPNLGRFFSNHPSVLGPARHVQGVHSSPALWARSILRANRPPPCWGRERLPQTKARILLGQAANEKGFIAEVKQSNGRNDLGRKTRQSIVERYPMDPFADQARRRLASLEYLTNSSTLSHLSRRLYTP
jgi:hypothetical protein